MQSSPKPEPARLKMISFRADDAVLDVLLRLEAAVEEGVVVRRRRSIAIRRALLEAGERLDRRENRR